MPDTTDQEPEAAPLQGLRWAIATLVVAAWLALYVYWLINGEQPACQVTTVTRTSQAVTTTRSCGLPDVTYYIYVFGLVALLLLPDAATITLGGFSFERRGRLLSRASKVAVAAGAGDTLDNATPAEAILDSLPEAGNGP